MAFWFSPADFTQVCVARGIVSWGSEDGAPAELQLWYNKNSKQYGICVKTSDYGEEVCKVIDVFTLHFQKCTDKIKTLLTKKSKFHFIQY